MIEKIELKNFKTFDEETFTLRPLTLIAGVNSMGKSSVIQSLLLLKQSYELEYLTRTDKQVRLKHDFVDLESAGSLCYSKADERVVEIALEANGGLQYRWTIDARDVSKESLECRYDGADMDKLSLFSKDFVFLAAERIGPRRTYSKTGARAYNTKLGVQGELTPAYLYRALVENEQIGIDAMRANGLAEGQNQLAENLNAWLSQVMNMGVKTFPSEIDMNNVRLDYGYEGEMERYSALQVGFGFSYSLPVVVALLAAKRGDLLVFENPEAHLHPSAQVNLGLMIAQVVANGVQVLVETHSDHILNGIRLARKAGVVSRQDVMAIFVQREQGVTFTNEIDVLDNGRLSARPPFFFDTWADALARLV